MEIELDGEMHASYAIAMSCLNSYSKQFTDTLKSQLQRAKDAMLATSTFCPDTTSADLRIAYVNMAAVDTEVYCILSVPSVRGFGYGFFVEVQEFHFQSGIHHFRICMPAPQCKLRQHCKGRSSLLSIMARIGPMEQRAFKSINIKSGIIL
jgi:hypothetical protein